MRHRGYDGRRVDLLKWGGWGGAGNKKHPKVDRGHCSSASIRDGGGNKKI